MAHIVNSRKIFLSTNAQGHRLKGYFHAGVLLLGLILAALCFNAVSFAATASEISADTLAETSAELSPLEKSQPAIFDWSQELIGADLPEAGHRFNELSRSERSALRQGFKLPLDAIAKSESINDLTRMSVLRPLPNPSKPFIPLDANVNASSNPFDKEANPNDLGPLGRMFALEGTKTETMPTSNASSSDPFASDDPFASNSPIEDPAMDEGNATDIAEPVEEDPFGSMEEDDPFGGF